MTYRVIKTIKGRRYVYEQETYRAGGKVRTKSRYIGPVDPIYQSAGRPTGPLLSPEDVVRCLQSADFGRFTANPERGRYPVAVASDHLHAILTFSQPEVFLSAETHQKIVAKHPEISIAEYQQLSGRLHQAEVFTDRGKANHWIFLTEETGVWWRAVVKVTAPGELYLQTYHRSNVRQVRKTKEREDRAL